MVTQTAMTSETEKLKRLEAELQELRVAHKFATDTGERGEAHILADQIREGEQLLSWLKSQAVPQG